MGVKGLWRLLMPIGRRISIETLEGKVLAIDASVWLIQFLKAMRDPETGSVRPAAHLIGFFRRLAKLRYHGIRPVLVFDGATPEIKKREVQQRRQRREQFASSGKGGIQRLAKRLLLEQLKKGKGVVGPETSSIQTNGVDSDGGGGAYAPGFQPAEEQESQETALRDSSSSQEEPSSREKKQSSTIDISHEAIMAEFAGLEDEWKDQEHAQAESDWDSNAVVEATASEQDEQRQASMYDYTNEAFDVKRISSLPSHERKDAVEEAKRHQRMRSRREFMPVAGQPQEYSQAQLRNFLRSSRLNIQINEMAKQVAAVDNGSSAEAGGSGEIGERIASDATRRIVLTKNNDGKDDSSTRNDNNPWRRLQKRASSFRTTKLPPEEEDDGEEFEWEDGESSTTPQAGNDSKGMLPDKAPNIRSKVLVEDAESDENDSDEGGGGFLPSVDTTSSKSHVQTNRVIQIDSCESDQEKGADVERRDESDSDEDGGGFLRSNAAKSSTSIEETRLIQVNSGESDEENGGVVAIEADSKGTKFATKPVINIHDDGVGDGFLAQRTLADARRAQEMEDEMLARAIQEAEKQLPGNAKGDETLHQSSGECSEQTILQIDRDAALAARLAVAESANIQVEHASIDDALDGDSDDIDWEDGDGNVDDSSSADDESDRKPASVLTKRKAPLLPLATQPLGLHASAIHDENKDTAWGDVDEGSGQKDVGADAALKSVVTESPMHSSLECAIRKQSSIESKTTKWQTQSDPEEEGAMNKSVAGTSDFDDVRLVDQNTMALEHAQATAANLTNWAGRAFRRAMAQHAEETGVSSPEKVSEKSTEVAKSHPMGGSRGDEVDGAYDKLLEGGQSSPILMKAPEAHVGSNRASSIPADSSPKDSSVSTDRKSVESKMPSQTYGDLLQDTSTASLQEHEDMLDAETWRQEQNVDTITDEMKAEVIRLVELFGIPYVESPAEAEAQCAKLEELGLVDGIVTEDSDVFVFGGNSVYKNIFDDQKYVEVYLANDAQRDLALNRNQMVALAMLLGGDYSEGVKGVGIVNGMEVLQAFDCSMNVKEGLTKFRKWLDGFEPDDAVVKKSRSKEGLSVEEKFRLKHKTARTQWVAPKNFPADNVMNAYMKPVVDTSTDRFTWGTPDIEKLLAFCQRNMGWEHNETRKLMDPVMERLEDTSRQTRLESYFMRYEDDLKFAAVKSKRLRNVFEDIQKDQASEARGASRKRSKQDSSNI